MELYLCEKPLQGKRVAEVLGASRQGKGYLHDGNDRYVTWLKGHLLVQAQPGDYDPGFKRWATESLPIVPEQWKLVVPSQSRDQYQIVRDLIRKATVINIATDYDREGEAIARNLLERARYRGRLRRIALKGMDVRSIRNALDNPMDGQSSLPLFEAALARSRADWLVGMNLTRLYTLLAQRAGVDEVFSVGRVQTCLVRLVVDRDNAIARFQLSDFYRLRATFMISGKPVDATWIPPAVVSDCKGRCVHEAIANRFRDILPGKAATVDRIENAERTLNAPLPFHMASLQQHCSKRFGISAKETTQVAQSLYEKHQAISYPRTNSGYLLTDQFGEAPEVFDALLKSDPSIEEALAGANPARMGRVFDNSKVGSHPGITPTCSTVVLTNMTELEQKVYRDIRTRFIAQFYPPAIVTRREIHVSCSNQLFRAACTQPVETGWKILYGKTGPDSEVADDEDEEEDDRKRIEDRGRVTALLVPGATEDPHEGTDEPEDEVSEIPMVRKGTECQCSGSTLATRATRPPARFSEGTLIAAMNRIGRYVQEEEYRQILDKTAGIGTPSTWASIIEECLKRGYLRREKKTIRSTDKASALMALVNREITSPGLTALWEQRLEQIAKGMLQREQFLTDIRQWVEGLVSEVKADAVRQTTRAQAALAEMVQSQAVPCPACGSNMDRERRGKEFRWLCRSSECGCSLKDVDGRPGPYTQ